MMSHRQLAAMAAEREQAAIKQEAISTINWNPCPFFNGDDLPDSYWKKYANGDFSLTLPEDEYFSFNHDGSFYWSDGSPGNANAYGRSIYLSPRDEMFFKPSSEDGGSFFLGRDAETGWERVYWENPEGQIVRTLRKHVVAASLPIFDVQTFTDVKGYERAVRLDGSGCYDCEDEKLMGYLNELLRRRSEQQVPATIEPWEEGLRECW